MNRHDRLQSVLELLTERGRLSVDQVAEALDVSPATVRRDFDQLGRQQLLTRTHGGAVSTSTAYDLPLRYRHAKHVEAKQRIAKAAADLVPNGAVVGMNGGTTTTEVARALAVRGDLQAGGDRPSLTLVTNALNIAHELIVRAGVKIVVTGGVARPQTYELTGPLVGNVLDGVHLDVALLGVDGINAELGATTHHEGEADVNRILAERAARVVVVADASKLGQSAFARICPLDRVDVVVTETGANVDVINDLEQCGVEVITA